MDIQLLLHGISIVAEKNVRIYYNKPPVIIFGLLFPLFLFLAFFIGRSLPLGTFYPGFIAMTLFFTSSSVGPLITPWEKRDKTYERLLSYPLVLESILLGDIAAGVVFGLAITFVVWGVSAIVIFPAVATAGFLIVAFLLGTVTFAALGTLMASPASDSPSNIMMLTSLLRFPLIFISGIFIPLAEIPGWGKVLAYLSPLTYLVDLFHAGLDGNEALSPFLDIAVLLGFTLVFILLARAIQKRNLLKGL
jgi:ABC-2 type transport system permease protein